MDLLWDILREMGILKKKVSKKKPASRPRRAKKPAEEDPLEDKRRSIAGDDPAAVARAIKRMIKKDG